MEQVQTQVQAPALNIKVELDKLRKMYTADIAQGTYNILALGEVGVGKTSLLNTCRFPALIHSFDPGGTKVLWNNIESGHIVADTRFEKEDSNSPTAYMDWEHEFFRLKNGGVFEKLGTYCIDSFTTFIEALKNQIVKKKSVKSKTSANYRGALDREIGLLEIQDWQVIGNVMRDMIKLCTSLPCDFILTGHLMLEKEEVSGRMIAHFNSIPSLRINIPLLFDEIYVLQSVETSQGVEHRILTQPTGRYVARTRIGSGKFDLYEEANVKKLLEKAGLSTADKSVI